MSIPPARRSGWRCPRMRGLRARVAVLGLALLLSPLARAAENPLGRGGCLAQ